MYRELRLTFIIAGSLLYRRPRVTRPHTTAKHSKDIPVQYTKKAEVTRMSRCAWDRIEGEKD